LPAFEFGLAQASDQLPKIYVIERGDLIVRDFEHVSMEK